MNGRSNRMPIRFQFNRMELAGSLGDLGTLLPLAMGMVLVVGLSPSGVFLAAGLFYIASGLYFGIPTAVQPMKVIGAYAIAAALTAQQVMAATLVMAVVLVLIALSGAMSWIGRHIPKSIIRGVQLSTGVLLMSQAVKMVLGTSTLQQLGAVAEPYLAWQTVAGVPIGLPLGIGGALMTLVLLDNRRIPAALALIAMGVLTGICLGDHVQMGRFGLQFQLPEILPFQLPGKVDFTFALFALVLPQVPMTLGNAVIANADLSIQYFGNSARRVTGRTLCISMALANGLSFLLGGIPMCHGAGGLAAHYRFGARTAGSNLLIGLFMVGAVLLMGDGLLSLFHLIPLAILGVLLFFAGGELALTITDLTNRAELFIPLVMLGVTLAANLAAAFCLGLLLHFFMLRLNIKP
jgi:SulP family sulfate permease